ncbi:uncharacterized protein LOC132746175 [Ruditapes philippinarum]|uniref:uncharacterized protein LOC132746175 n=1 Tax=Ruditapes philippinarum TaxID=129788 RepID=UPI00295A6B06|nr:uncharacterized protein LOC132746175 [Ruditapes philippinarum]
MSSAKGFYLLVILAAALPVTESWRWDFDWSTEEPANCPHNSTETNICSSLVSMNGTCVSIKCCHEFDDDDEYDYYDDSMAESEEENVYYFGRVSGCRMCFSVSRCSVYKCYERCCFGYEEDYYGRCRNHTGHMQCQNGGTPRKVYHDYYCVCPAGFEGKSCEIPICQCENGGDCVVKDGRPYCNCSVGHYGERCEQTRCEMSCMNGGTCLRNDTLEYCFCHENYVGKYCEHYFNQPEMCPVPVGEQPYCATYCTRNSDCGIDEVCCKEGCTTTCRRKKVDYCEYLGRQYEIGQFKPNDCENCTCMYNGDFTCTSMSCATIKCRDGRDPITKPGQCCPTCPETPSRVPPTLYRCPTGVLRLNTTYYEDYSWIDQENTHILAWDSENAPLEVRFEPRFVKHCHCKDASRKVSVIKAFATDKYGNMAICTFKVTVHDIFAPIFKSCPEDIYVFENYPVRWKEPISYDNVGVAYKTCSDLNGKVLPVGVYPLTYHIQDYDRNSAFCRFRISVTPEDASIEDMPQGLKNRSKDKPQTMLIIAPIIGGIFLVLFAVMVFLCCKRRTARHQGPPTPAYDNNIYATPCDIDIKLPAYSDLPMNPPAYSITGSEKDVEYMSVAPPSYTNPGYETLKVHVGRSGSVKSNKSDQSERVPDDTK